MSDVPAATIAEVLAGHADNNDVALRFEEESWTYAEYVAESRRRAGLWWSVRKPAAPPHIGVLLDNVPDYLFWMGAAALTGSTVVGINSTYRGAELARLITHTDCQLIVTEGKYLELLESAAADLPRLPVRNIDEDDYAKALDNAPAAPAITPDPTDLFLLIFTSGSTAAPKAVRCTQGRIARTGRHVSAISALDASDVVHPPLPLFHSSGLFTGWSSAVTVGASMVLRRRFSASGFLPDVRRYEVTFLAYTGKVLNYILATPEKPDDADNTLRLAIGNEASEADLATFTRRYACEVRDSYGSTENLIIVRRSPTMPAGALGTGADGVKILNPETGVETQPGVVGPDGRLSNEDMAVGELVQVEPGNLFEGYYRNPEADQARFRNGIYWSGDLAYRDADGWIYFVGRDNDWLRVDGENFASRPVEQILAGFPGVRGVAVYAVPDAAVGDRVMAALEMDTFDPVAFDAYLDEHPDLGTKWRPAFVRVVALMPALASLKTDKRLLRREAWECSDPVWWRSGRGEPLLPLDGATAESMHGLLVRG
jgi:fatty-acyl-CoA synthase